MDFKKAFWILFAVGVATILLVVGGFYLYDRNLKKPSVPAEPIGKVFYSNGTSGVSLRYIEELGLVCFEKSCWKLRDASDEIKAHYTPEMLAKIASPPAPLKVIPPPSPKVEKNEASDEEEDDNIEVDENGEPVFD